MKENTDFFSGKEADWTERDQEHIFVRENLLCNKYFLMIKFSQISHSVLHLCPFLSDVNQIFKDKCSIWMNCSSLFRWVALWVIFWNPSLNFLWKNSKLVMKDTKQKHSWIANYEAAFRNLSSTNRNASSEKKFLHHFE